MKKAFIVYFKDNNGVVVIAPSVSSAIASLEPDQVDNVARVDSIPYPVL